MEKSKDKQSEKIVLRAVGQALFTPLVFFSSLLGLYGIYQSGRIIYLWFTGSNIMTGDVISAFVCTLVLIVALIFINKLNSRHGDVWQTLATRWTDKQQEEKRIERLMQKHHSKEFASHIDEEMNDYIEQEQKVESQS